MTYPLVLDIAAGKIPVAVTCRVLGFSKQAFYAWKKSPVQRDRDDAHLINSARDIHADDPAFGYRFIADELPARGVTAGENRVARLCSQRQIWSVFSSAAAWPARPGRRCTTTWWPPVHRRCPGPYLADRHHRAPNCRGQAIPLRDQGRLVQPHRRVLDGLPDDREPGCLRLAQRHRAPLPGRNRRGALGQGQPVPVRRVRPHPAHRRPDRVEGRVGACGGTAAMESFFALLQKNVLDRQRRASREQLRLAIITWIERTCHRRRRQRGLGRLTPIDYETINQAAHAA
jgi:transposase InsO family protein